jgi:hypothetical protein
MYLLCTDVGLVHPTNFSRTRRRSRLEVPLATIATRGPLARDTERVLRRVEQNLTALTHAGPMTKIEDLSPSMQPHVVGVPQTWVQLFQHLENVVIHYSRANRPRY